MFFLLVCYCGLIELNIMAFSQCFPLIYIRVAVGKYSLKLEFGFRRLVHKLGHVINPFF